MSALSPLFLSLSLPSNTRCNALQTPVERQDGTADVNTNICGQNMTKNFGSIPAELLLAPFYIPVKLLLDSNLLRTNCDPSELAHGLGIVLRDDSFELSRRTSALHEGTHTVAPSVNVFSQTAVEHHNFVLVVMERSITLNMLLMHPPIHHLLLYTLGGCIEIHLFLLLPIWYHLTLSGNDVPRYTYYTHFGRWTMHPFNLRYIPILKASLAFSSNICLIGQIFIYLNEVALHCILEYE